MYTFNKNSHFSSVGRYTPTWPVPASKKCIRFPFRYQNPCTSSSCQQVALSGMGYLWQWKLPNTGEFCPRLWTSVETPTCLRERQPGIVLVGWNLGGVSISSSLISLCGCFLWPECVFTLLQVQKASEQRCGTVCVCVSEGRKKLPQAVDSEALQVPWCISAQIWQYCTQLTHFMCVCVCVFRRDAVDFTLFGHQLQIQTFISEGQVSRSHDGSGSWGVRKVWKDREKEKKIHMKAQNPLLWESEYTYTQLKTAFFKKSFLSLTFDKNFSEWSSKIKSFSKSR